MAEPSGTSELPTLNELMTQSTHELEFDSSLELDLHKHVACKKNPDHGDFIPVGLLEHPKFHETPFSDITELKKFCQHVAKETVKLKVQRVSSKRSKISNFPLSANAGERITSLGSGCLTDIDVSGKERSFPCPLENCPHSKEPHQVYGYIIITTAAHVVFDDEEAIETIVEFFDDHPTDISTVETVYGVSVRKVEIPEDNCELGCVTHSVSLFQQIHQMVAQRATHPHIFKFADEVENMPTFISVLSALADIRESCSQDRLNQLCHNVQDKVETMCTYEKRTEILPDSEELNTFLLKTEQVTQQNGLVEKVLRFLSSKEMICDFTEISFQVLIEKVSILGAFSLLSNATKQRLNNFVQDFFGQIIDCLNEVTCSSYQNTRSYIENTIVVHISHPHGLSKQVCLGKYFNSKTQGKQRRHIYTVPTCNGCSGGPVWILPGGRDRKVRWEQVYGGPHGGCFDRENNLNHSSSQVLGVLQVEKFFDILSIRPYGQLLENIEDYQHLLKIGPYQDLPDIRYDIHVENFIKFSHPQWKDLGYTLLQHDLYFRLNQHLNMPQADSQSLSNEPAESCHSFGSMQSITDKSEPVEDTGLLNDAVKNFERMDMENPGVCSRQMVGPMSYMFASIKQGLLCSHNFINMIETLVKSLCGEAHKHNWKHYLRLMVENVLINKQVNNLPSLSAICDTDDKTRLLLQSGLSLVAGAGTLTQFKSCENLTECNGIQKAKLCSERKTYLTQEYRHCSPVQGKKWGTKTFIKLGLCIVFLSMSVVLSATCPQGTYLYRFQNGQPSVCVECAVGTFIPYTDHSETHCRRCENIEDPELEILVSPCNITHDAVIHCGKGYFRDLARNPRETGTCKKCINCSEHRMFTGQPCSTYRNTICCWDENFDVAPNHHGVPLCRERPWFCRQGHYFDTSGYQCLPCPDNTFMHVDFHVHTECFKCRDYTTSEANNPLHSVIAEPCNSTHDAVLRCQDGFFMKYTMSYRMDAIGCSPCTDCSTTEAPYVKRTCDSMHDTVCCSQPDMMVVDGPDGPVCETPVLIEVLVDRFYEADGQKLYEQDTDDVDGVDNLTDDYDDVVEDIENGISVVSCKTYVILVLALIISLVA